MSNNRRGKKANMSSYGAWADMLQRCKNPNLKNYHRYGGRGIRVCEEWHNFDDFYRDMGDKPKGMSLGRIDNDGNYEPSNCRWETVEEQQNNKVGLRFIDYKNERLTIAQLARKSNTNPITFRTRLKRGWGIEEAMNMPSFTRGNHR